MTKALKRNQLEIFRVWDISTCHISKEDADRLPASGNLSADPYREGCWVCVPDKAELADEQFMTRLQVDDKLTPSIGLILTIAESKGIGWIRLDSAGPIYDFLPVYHW